MWRFGARRRRSPPSAHSPCRGPCVARPRRWRRGVGEPERGGSTRPGAEQCGTTVRHCVIPSSESIRAQRGADVRVVKDPQGGCQPIRSTGRGGPCPGALGALGRWERWGRWERSAPARGPGNSPSSPDHVAATSSGISDCGCDCGYPTSDGLGPCQAPTDGRRGHLKRDSSDGNRGVGVADGTTTGSTTSPGSANGSVTGSITGWATGSVTGSVACSTGSVTGSVACSTGSATG